jgi:hypothetical protein
LRDFEFLFLIRYISTKSHIHETYGTLKKMSFFTKEYAEFHMQRPLFDIITAYRNVLH